MRTSTINKFFVMCVLIACIFLVDAATLRASKAETRVEGA